jgi:hypothetical protein
VRIVELEDLVEEADQRRLVVLAPEDPLEDEVGLGIGEDGRAAQGATLAPARRGREAEPGRPAG